jgi:hypothetical protein
MIKEIDAEMSQCPIPINLSSSLVPFVLLLPLYGLPRPGQCLFHLPTNAVTSASAGATLRILLFFSMRSAFTTLGARSATLAGATPFLTTLRRANNTQGQRLMINVAKDS